MEAADWCIDDCRAAITLAAGEGAEEIALLGFSMGGAVAIAAADHPLVTTVIGLAPWIPDRLDVGALDGRRVAIIHGAARPLAARHPRRQPEELAARLTTRIRERGIDATHTVIPRAVHGAAVRSRGGRLVPLPRAGRWVGLVGEELSRFAGPVDRTSSRSGDERRPPSCEGRVASTR